jgi:hypothetical protein
VSQSDGAAIDMDLLAASLRADASDLNAFVESLAAKLEDAIPGNVTVERSRRGMLGPKLVRRIAVDAADQRLELVRGAGESVQTTGCRLSGGIVLKRESLDMDAWLAALGATLADEAQRSKQTRQALERMLLD